MTPVYVGNRMRILCVLALLKLQGKQSYCSFKEYAHTLKRGKIYELRDEGMVVFISKIR